MSLPSSTGCICNERAGQYIGKARGLYFTECYLCHRVGPNALTPEMAANAWNSLTAVERERAETVDDLPDEIDVPF